jgi:lipid-A-disaccharide synthase
MECAYFGVPTVAFYKTSWLTYEIGKRIVTVAFLAMPNLLAGQELFPEFIQHRATADNLAHAALELLNNEGRRQAIREKLRKIITSLGPPGAARRAARAIINLVRAYPAVTSSQTLAI